MNQTTKTILIILGSLLVLCVCGAAILIGTGLWGFGKFAEFAETSATEDPQEVSQIASSIAHFDIPNEFNKQYGIKIATFSMVQYTTNREDTFIIVTQFPPGTSIQPDEMMRQIQEGSRDPNSPWYNVESKQIEQKSIMIRGKESTLSISEGTTDQGVTFRLANAVFQGNGQGPALLMIGSPTDRWDEQMVEEFIASIQ